MHHSHHIAPTNQPHGHPGRTSAGHNTGGGPGSGNPGGAGAGAGAGRNVTTPTAMYNPGTTFNAGDIVMLLHDCGSNFRKGTVVEITGIEPTPESATKRPGQDGAWLHRDEDSVYRFRRKYAKEHITVIHSVDCGDPPSHFDIVPAPGQPHSPEQYPLNSVLCTVNDMTFIYGNSNRNRIRVPRYTYCKVAEFTTRKGGRQAARELMNRRMIERCFYVLQAKYLTYTWEYEICSRKKEVYNFRALRPEEMRDYLARNLPANKVVNWQ